MGIYKLVCGSLLTLARDLLWGWLPAPKQQAKFTEVAWLQQDGGNFIVVLHFSFND